MVAAVRQQADREQIYAIVRREILSGTIASDQVLTSAELNARFACVGKAAQEVLVALAADGYLRKTTGGFVREHWPNEEVEELLEHLMLLHEICALRLPDDGPEKIEELHRCRIEYEIGKPDETRFLALLNWIRIGLTASRRSTVAELAAKLIPSALMRVSWPAIQTCSEIATVMAALENQLALGDACAARACVNEFWQIVQRRHAEFHKEDAAPVQFDAEAVGREPDLAGKRAPFGRSDRMRNELLPRLEDNPRRSPKLPY